MNKIKEKYKRYLYRYLGAEIFADKTLKMDEVTKSVFIILLDFYNRATFEIDNSSDMQHLNNTFYRYKSLMNETVNSYINIYCDENNVSYEKIKYNVYLINNKKIINIEDGFTYIYKSLSRIVKKKKITKYFIESMKDAFMFR